MKKINLIITLLAFSLFAKAQTSWKGITSTNWSTASNWTSGVPNSTTDAIIGDASFTGSFQPVLTANSSCKSLTIGSGTKASTLTVSKNMTSSGTITIGANGTISHTAGNTSLSLKGNWINSGVYTTSLTTNKVVFSGTSQSITGATTFRQLIINNGSTTTLANNIIVTNFLSLSGTLDATATLNVSGTGSLTVNSTGKLLVKAADFSTNYSISGTITLHGSSTVNYASSVINQNITNTLTYGYLRISGSASTTKTLIGNLPSLNSSAGTYGRIYIDAGTLDLSTFTANRGAPAGGNLIMAASTRLKIGGTNSLPSNFNSRSFAVTSTVEYCGTNQTVVAASYGNLIFSSSSGSVVKTMPATAMIIAGSFTSTPGLGTDVSFTAGNNITVNVNTVLDANTTFNAGSYTHAFRGNWQNNGVYNGGTSSTQIRGVNAALTGTGTNNFFSLTFYSSGITAASSTSISVAGNLATSGPGIFTHNAGGLLTMTGVTKTISGNGFKLSDVVVTGTVTTSANVTISGNLTINGSFIASGGLMTLNGTPKAILGGGNLSFYSLSVVGTITTAKDFSVTANLSVALAAAFTQTAGTTTFNSTINVLSGTANLYNVTIASGKTLRLGSNSILGIGNIFTKTGTLNVTTSVPNTVTYNSSSAQSVVNTSYYNLIIDNNSTKTSAGSLTINNDFTINPTATFSASSHTVSLYRHFTNNGTFTASTSTVQLLGANAANITGATTFYNLTQNKSSAALKVTLNNSIITNTLAMTTGNMSTGSNSVTINNTRTGNGIIIGIISHNHAFVNGTTYYFEGPDNGITFTSPSAGLTQVTLTVSIGTVSDFNGSECINREYGINIPNGTYTNATFRMHYEDNELNAFYEPSLVQYHYNTGSSIWDSIGYTTRNATTNYVEKTSLTNINGRWTLSGVRDVVRWNGSISSAWETAANWTTISGASMLNRVPNSTDEAQIGQATFTNNPVISSARTISSLNYGSVQQSTLTINSGASLTTIGAIRGLWSTNASHVLNVSAGTLSVGTTIILSDGTSSHDIELKIGSGSAVINSDLIQIATGAVNFTGSGTLSIAGNYSYTAGNFTSNSGTVIYTGSNAQNIAPLTYHHLTITKTTEDATINAPTIVNGNLTTSTGGGLVLNDSVTVAGNITIGASTSLTENSIKINVAGNWTNNGVFNLNNGTLNFNGSANQSVNANVFNTVLVNKTGGELSLTGDVSINSNLTITSGTVNLSSFLANRSNSGGVLTLASAAYLKVAEVSNFPANFITNTLHASSTVEYNGSVAQDVVDIDYGNLTFSNGGSNVKTLLGDIEVNGNLLINSGAALNPDALKITAFGNIANNGTFTPGTSTMLLKGTSKSMSGNWTFNNLTVTGTYTSTGTSVTMTGNLFVDVGAAMNFNTTTTSLDGNLTNRGTLTSNSVATFTGIQEQTLQLFNAISSSGGIVNFNGTIPPILNSNTSPTFAIVNINNTGGITATVPWVVAVACNIGAGATFDGGALTHTFYGNFTNNGTLISSGELKFTPIPPYSAAATINLGTASYTNTGKTTFGGTVPLTIVGSNPSLYDVSITNTNIFGITPPNNWVIDNELFVETNAIFNAGAATSHTLVGEITNNGIINGNTSTISLIGNPISIKGIGLTSFNNITIASVADVTLNQDIEVLGNFTNDGVFYSNGYQLSFTGSSNSIINGASGALTIDELKQNKTGSAITTLSVPVIVNSALDLSNGVIQTSTVNILTLINDATSSSGNATSFVDGPMKKIGNDAFDFPVGDGTYWARIGMTAPSSVTSEFQAQYFNAAYSSTTCVAPLDHVSSMEHWILNRNSGTDNVSATLFWESGARSFINDLNTLVVARFNGTNWVSETQAGGTTGTTSAGSVKSQLITSFSPFAYGSTSSSYNPLPIELIEFKASCQKNHVQITWRTATEINNQYFIIEKSINGIDWQKLSQINGAGNSISTKNYNYLDYTTSNDIVYYRLIEVDNNGTKKINEIISSNCDQRTSDNMTLYPNPAKNNLNINFNLSQNYGEGTLKIINTLGNIVLEQSIDLSQGFSQNKLVINLPSGLYSVIVNSDNLILPAQQVLIN